MKTLKQLFSRGCCIAGLVVGLTTNLLSADPVPAAADFSAILVNAVGSVEYQKASGGEWVSVKVGHKFSLGDRLRTGDHSRADLRLTDLSVLRLPATSSISLEPLGPPESRTGLGLKSGQLYFYSREKPGSIRFRTPIVSGAIRGTEFQLAATENGETTLTLLDGEVTLENEHGRLDLQGGEQSIVRPGQAPRKTAVVEAVNVIQWCLYYPGVLDADELALTADEQQRLVASLAAYRDGDLLAALAKLPAENSAASDREKIFRAALSLAVGEVEPAVAALDKLQNASPAANALRRLVAVVKGRSTEATAPPQTATEWLVESYHQQSRSKLDAALQAARAAAAKSPGFGFAHARVAELEFSFGRLPAAEAALAQTLALSPRLAQALALRGFILGARLQSDAARESFDQALAMDGGLANAWLGQGLLKIRQGRIEAGRADLQIAAAMEPNRSLLRSYLGKAFSRAGNPVLATKEFRLAKQLDAGDPTPWLYSALLGQQESRINEAIHDLERSQALNDNRSIFRSRLLLDQDQAVRSANLAAIYSDAGLTEVGVREAGRAVQGDYANHSAHLFLANSYNDLTRNQGVNLRHETPTVNEYLMATLLAPVGEGNLSRTVSQQEYGRFFARDRVGVANSTEYWSRGDLDQSSTVYGHYGKMSFAVDANYHTEPGTRPNNDLYQLSFSALIKMQFSPKDTVFAQVFDAESESGDRFQYYNQASGDPTVRVDSAQKPLVLAGYHREWNPASHTLLLFSRLRDDTHLNDPQQGVQLLTFGPTGFTPSGTLNADYQYRSALEIYSAEAQQIWQGHEHTVIAGGRFQIGQFETFARQVNAAPPGALAFIYPAGFDSTQNFANDFQRISGYAYDNWRAFEPLLLTAGVSYDQIRYPQNFRNAPTANSEESREKISPKAGLIWTPTTNTTLRAHYTRSLGGVSFDQSFQLEPTLVAGLNQSFRSVIPESAIGAASVPTMESWALGLDQRFNTGTYLGVDGELLFSNVRQTFGAYSVTLTPSSTQVNLSQVSTYAERTIQVRAHQLLGDYFSVGARYRISDADLNNFIPEFAPAVATANVDRTATLQELQLTAHFNHPGGIFAQFESLWFNQSNRGDTPALPGDDFWQFNFMAGYRFLHRHAELRAGVLNLTGQNYQLNPLNLYNELPRARTFTVSCRFTF